MTHEYGFVVLLVDFNMWADHDKVHALLSFHTAHSYLIKHVKVDYLPVF